VVIRVLLAEDNESLVMVLKKLLTGLGLDVVTAKTGLDAQKILTGEQIDILLLDLKLPVMNGIDLLHWLRTSPRLSRLPVMVMTAAFKGPRNAEAARRFGVRCYLEKPFTQHLFLESVSRILKEVSSRKNVRLLDLLVDIYNRGDSGILAIAGGPPVSFINGEPFSFLSRNREEFPAFLVSRGKIGPADLRHFVDSGEERIFLTQAGLLTYEELVEESRLFLVKHLSDGLAKEGPAEFVKGHPEAHAPLVPLSLPHLLYENLKTHPSRFDALQSHGRFGNHYPARTPLFYRRINLTSLRKEDIALLDLVNGERPLDEILRQGGDAAGGAGFFYFLHSLGMIVFNDRPGAEALPDFALKNLFNRPLEEPAAASDALVDFDDLVEEVAGEVELVAGEEGMAAPLSSDEIGFEQMVQRDYAAIRDKNYYEIFGLSRSSFSFTALKDAYFEKTRLYSPERFMEISGATLALAQDVLSHYANAYSTLSSVVAKERYDELLNANTVMGINGKRDDQLQARIQFESGSAFLRMEEYENAEKALQEAYTLEPNDAKHCALLAWAMYRNPANRNSRAALEKVRMLLGKSLQCGRNAEAFAYRGWMLLEEGRDGLAEGEFLKSLKLNPKEAVARSGMRLIEEKREADRKGILRKLFG